MNARSLGILDFNSAAAGFGISLPSTPNFANTPRGYGFFRQLLKKLAGILESIGWILVWEQKSIKSGWRIALAKLCTLQHQDRFPGIWLVSSGITLPALRSLYHNWRNLSDTSGEA